MSYLDGPYLDGVPHDPCGTSTLNDDDRNIHRRQVGECDQHDGWKRPAVHQELCTSMVRCDSERNRASLAR
jgi:hypothetical protein